MIKLSNKARELFSKLRNSLKYLNRRQHERSFCLKLNSTFSAFCSNKDNSAFEFRGVKRLRKFPARHLDILLNDVLQKLMRLSNYLL